VNTSTVDQMPYLKEITAMHPSALDYTDISVLQASASRVPHLEQRIKDLTGRLNVARDMAQAAPELNMRNYDKAEVSKLNEAMIEIYLFLNEQQEPS
jgi:plasmid replication initiation protein